MACTDKHIEERSIMHADRQHWNLCKWSRQYRGTSLAPFISSEIPSRQVAGGWGRAELRSDPATRSGTAAEIAKNEKNMA
jgi:hypothetical protein